MVLIIDNYDSFTYNIAQYIGELSSRPIVRRNNEITASEAKELNPSHLIISPGPCTPNETGNSLEIIEQFSNFKPILGVCLGHQCIGQYFGGIIKKADKIMHGKTSPIQHFNDPLFRELPNPFDATRYHSLILERETLPDCLDVIAETKENEIMGVKHKNFPIWGIQFHPESLETPSGIKILQNFLNAQ